MFRQSFDISTPRFKFLKKNEDVFHQGFYINAFSATNFHFI